MGALVLALLSVILTSAASHPAVGPAHGSLVVVGGGKLGPEIVDRFFDLAGGPDAPIILIPTADDRDSFGPDFIEKSPVARGSNVTLLHTRSRALADSEDFVAPIRKARGVWIAGGRQWRLVDAYLNTRTERELQALLDRGGVIGGTSAGATILGSYLVRGAREGNTIMMAKGYEEGFGFLHHVAVDQHLLTRHRENDMVAVVQSHPDLLGVGLDENTAMVVHGDTARFIGASKAAIYDPRHQPGPDGKPYYFVTPGTTFDLAARKVIHQ